MNVPEALIHLLAAAIHGRTVPFYASELDEAQWMSVLGAAAAQNIHTLVFDALPENVPDAVLDVWKKQTAKMERYNGRIAAVAAAQEETWRKLGLNYAMLKGISVASMYPRPEHRGSGDIDWCFGDDRSWNIALDLAGKHASDGVHTDSDGDVNYVWKGVMIEHHRDWTHLASRRKREKIGSPRIVDGRLGPEDVLLMQNAHILHHLSTSGIGMKQIADMTVAYEHYAGRYDMNEFVSRLEKSGLINWTALIHSVLVELTGISPSVLPVQPVLDDPDTDKIIRLIFSDGSFGTGGNQKLSRRFMRAALAMKYCPREVLSRYWYLITGRLKR